MGASPLLASSADSDPTIRCVYVNREEATLAVAFSHAVIVSPRAEGHDCSGGAYPPLSAWGSFSCFLGGSDFS